MCMKKIMLVLLCGFLSFLAIGQNVKAQTANASVGTLSNIGGLYAPNVGLGTTTPPSPPGPTVYNLTASIVTNKSVYLPGEMVYATIYVSNPNVGIFLVTDYAKNNGSTIKLYNGTTPQAVSTLPTSLLAGPGPKGKTAFYSFSFKLTNTSNVALGDGQYRIESPKLNFFTFRNDGGKDPYVALEGNAVIYVSSTGK